MGTRGSVGFRLAEEDKVQYNHFDSYPSGLGAEVLDFLSSSNIEELKTIAGRIVLVKENDKPTAEQIAECRAFADTNVGNQKIDDWYCLLRGAQGSLGAYRDGLRYMLDGHNFLADGLFCEYAYIVNLDTEKLEFYIGFSKVPTPGRYGNLTSGQSPVDGIPEYYGVKLVLEVPLADIFGADEAAIKALVEQMEAINRDDSAGV